MLYKVIIAKNVLTLVVEEVCVEAKDKDEAIEKALSGDVLHSDIVEATDVADIGEEIEEVLPEGGESCYQNKRLMP